jgi:hypothetical protein
VGRRLATIIVVSHISGLASLESRRKMIVMHLTRRVVRQFVVLPEVKPIERVR